jgi:predicted MFS family arabinose efflux permease
LYGFIPKREHKLTYAIFGDYCVSNSDKIFPGNCLLNSLILAVLAAGVIIVGLASGILWSIASIPLLLLIGISVGALTGGLVYENIKYKSVYRISEIE